MSETRAALVYCPYCGDEDLHPAEAPAAARGQGPPTTSTSSRATSETESPGSPGWECRSCLRVFRVSLLGLAPRPSTVPTPSSFETQE